MPKITPEARIFSCLVRSAVSGREPACLALVEMPGGLVALATASCGDRHEMTSSSCGELHMVVVTDAIISHKPDEGKLVHLPAHKESEFRRKEGGLPGRGGFWMDYLRAVLKGGVVQTGAHCLLSGPGLPQTNLALSS